MLWPHGAIKRMGKISHLERSYDDILKKWVGESNHQYKERCANRRKQHHPIFSMKTRVVVVVGVGVLITSKTVPVSALDLPMSVLVQLTRPSVVTKQMDPRRVLQDAIFFKGEGG